MTLKLAQSVLQGRHASSAPSSVKKILRAGAPEWFMNGQRRLMPRKRRIQRGKFFKVVVNGRYHRLRLPDPIASTARADVVHMRPADGLKAVVAAQKQTARADSKESTGRLWSYRKVLAWIKLNLPVMALNVGSMCILFGFSRSDVLELRALTMTGQLTFAAYNLAQKTILWPSIAWSGMFAGVNALKIWDVLHERTAEVHMSDQQEEIFVKHFMAHGITPKQFERIETKATKLQIEQGSSIISEGELLDHVYLVVKGSTHAHIYGKKLSAASTNQATCQLSKPGGDSGAWVGELTLLDKLWEYEETQKNADSEKVLKLGRGISLYTILADEPCTVLRWSHGDLAEVMESSTDLRSALTRAMTSAVVGKVVNLTLTRSQSAKPAWLSWLADWRNINGAQVQVLDARDTT